MKIIKTLVAALAVSIAAMTTILIGVVAVLAYAYFGLKARRTREQHGYEAEPFTLFVIKTLVTSALALFLVYQFATYKGLPIVLMVAGGDLVELVAAVGHHPGEDVEPSGRALGIG